jgi:P4 family phage/plasmid primase-like protien
MNSEIQKYKDQKLVIFSININHSKNKSGKWKKDMCFPKDWNSYTMKTTQLNPKHNGLALLTGKINNIIVIDIDNIDHWNQLLEKYNEEEPDTVKAISGSGGKHLYFRYTNEFKEVKSNTKCFGHEYDIDIRTNGGCIIIPPSKYFNNEIKKEVKYIWENKIFENEIKQIPIWMKDLLLNKKENKKSESKNKNQEIILNEKFELQNYEIDKDETEIDFNDNDIEILVNMLIDKRNENYNDWLNIGICLFNLNKQYLHIWKKWSQKSDKYEEGACDKKWKSFKKDKNGLKIGSLLLWAKQDNPIKYEIFIRKKKLNEMIYSKYPDDKLLLGETVIVNDKCQYTKINNKKCLIKGGEHDGMNQSMYVEVIDKFMTIKCQHPECFGKTYPCNHILMNKNEMNIAFHGDVNITINQGKDDELVEFQKIDIYEDDQLNELVFNGLSSESSQLADLMYYFYGDCFNYGEDDNWYAYENHKWYNIGIKNTKLRHTIQKKLGDLYFKLLNYYKSNFNDKKKEIMIKDIIKNLGNTSLKNNIMTELIDLYSENKNPKRNFTKKLDSNNYLIGFENGVYNLKTFEFREGKHDDYITMTVGYNYQEKHTKKYEELLNFLKDIQPNKEEREYMLTYLSIGLIGNQLELFTILTGSGRNGKSKLIELLKITLGDYFGSVQSQMFTRPRPDANSPDPGLLSLMKKRIIMASEPEKNSKLNSGFIKFITGRDSTTLRNCHSNDMIDFTANFITLLICNDIPDCDDIDNAFSKRLRCLNFPTEFVNEPTKENQKKINVNINENFEYWKTDFILLLIEYYKKYSENKELNPTENIFKWTNQYKENTDIYLQFINENTEESHTHISTTTLYEGFKVVYKNENPNSKIPSNREFIKNIKKYITIESVKIDGKAYNGTKHIKLKDFL